MNFGEEIKIGFTFTMGGRTWVISNWEGSGFWRIVSTYPEFKVLIMTTEEIEEKAI